MSKHGIVHSPLWDSNVPKKNFIYTKDEQEPVQLNTCSTNISGNRCPTTSVPRFIKSKKNISTRWKKSFPCREPTLCCNEPYLMGLSKAGVKANEAIVIENAPLGVVSGTAAQIFTIAVNTGPIPAQALIEAGADMVFPSMPDFANHVDELIHTLKITR